MAGRPNEACGLIAGSAPALEGGLASRFLPLTNVAASPFRYLIDPNEQLRAMLDIDDADEVVWGIVHSHVMSPAVPSDTDVGLAAYPDALYLHLLAAGPEPLVRAWAIRDGVVNEVQLRVGAVDLPSSHAARYWARSVRRHQREPGSSGPFPHRDLDDYLPLPGAGRESRTSAACRRTRARISAETGPWQKRGSGTNRALAETAPKRGSFPRGYRRCPRSRSPGSAR